MALSRENGDQIEIKESKMEAPFANAIVSRSVMNDAMSIGFSSRQQAEEHLAWIKQKLSADRDMQEAKIFANAFELTTRQWLQLQGKIREEAVRQLPKTDFIIKSLRADENCFFSDYIKGITPPFVKRPLRKASKSPFTVTGKGVVMRAEKKPHYTPEQKQGFSKPQSSSLGTPVFFPQVFGFDKDRYEVLVGVFIDIKDVLLSHRNYIYDGGTVRRPYDFMTLEEAKSYAEKKVNKVLFSADKLSAFKKAISDPLNKNNYNEVMPRQRWNIDGTSQIFIANDTLESRLQAQEYALLVKKRLLEEKTVTDDYIIRLFYYLPSRPELNFKEYTREEQAMDRLNTMLLHEEDRFLRLKKYKNNHYQFLLTFPREKIKKILQEILSEDMEEQQLLWRILREGYIHVLESLAERLGESIKDIIALADEVNDRNPFACYNLMRKGYFDAAQELIKKHKQGIDFNQYNEESKPLLYVAAREGNVQLVSELLARGADGNKVCANGYTPLYIAAQQGHLVVVAALLKYGADGNKGSGNGATPLYIAAQQGHFAVVTALLEYGVDVNKVCAKGDAPLHIAAQLGHLAIVKALLAKGADCYLTCTIYSLTPLYLAVEKGYHDVVKALLVHGVDCNRGCRDNGKTPLYLAAEEGYLDVVKVLLAHGADCNKEYASPLFAAVQYKHCNVTEYLLEAKAEINTVLKGFYSKSILAMANEQNKKIRFEEFIKKHYQGIIPEKVFPGASALHLAALIGQIKMVALLLQHGVDPALKTVNGVSAHDFSLAMGHQEVVFMLAKYEQQPLLKDRNNAFRIIEQVQQVSEEKQSDIDKNERNSRITAFLVLDQYAMRLANVISVRKTKNNSQAALAKLDRLVAFINQAYRNCQLENSSVGLDHLLQKLRRETNFIIHELEKEQSFLSKLGLFSEKSAAAELQELQILTSKYGKIR